MSWLSLAPPEQCEITGRLLVCCEERDTCSKAPGQTTRGRADAVPPSQVVEVVSPADRAASVAGSDAAAAALGEDAEDGVWEAGVTLEAEPASRAGKPPPVQGKAADLPAASAGGKSNAAAVGKVADPAAIGGEVAELRATAAGSNNVAAAAAQQAVSAASEIGEARLAEGMPALAALEERRAADPACGSAAAADPTSKPSGLPGVHDQVAKLEDTAAIDAGAAGEVDVMDVASQDGISEQLLPGGAAVAAAADQGIKVPPPGMMHDFAAVPAVQCSIRV